jgi:multiple sugar transport system permease protein
LRGAQRRSNPEGGAAAQQYEIQHGQMAAASIIATIPAILLMFVGQRFVIQGLTLGSVI